MLIFKYFDGDCWNWVPGVVRVSSTMVAKRADAKFKVVVE